MEHIDIELLKDTFDKTWINQIKNVVNHYVNNNKDVINKKYFSELGNYSNRNDDFVDKNLSDYFSRLLYAPNLAILDYIIKNHQRLKDLKFIDNGAGLGILSIFLKKIGIECYNYDNFSQIKNVTFHNDVLDKIGIEIYPITDSIPSDCEFLVCSGIWVDNPEFLNRNLKYVILDANWENEGIGPIIKNKFKLVTRYNTSSIWEKIK
jgi:hypothetical protein